MKKVDWRNATKKEIEEEFRHLLHVMAETNGAQDLIDVVEGIPNIGQKKAFVTSWHDQDEG